MDYFLYFKYLLLIFPKKRFLSRHINSYSAARLFRGVLNATLVLSVTEGQRDATAHIVAEQRGFCLQRHVCGGPAINVRYVLQLAATM